MTEPAAIQALRLEVKKDKWEQLQNGTYKLQVTVNPADLNDNADAVLLQFIKAGMGDRFMMGVAKIGEDEQPEKTEKPKRPPATTRAEKARRLCGVPEFQQWLSVEGYEAASQAVKLRCAVGSKNLFDTDQAAAKAWDKMLTRYEQQSGRMAEVHG